MKKLMVLLAACVAMPACAGLAYAQSEYVPVFRYKNVHDGQAVVPEDPDGPGDPDGPEDPDGPGDGEDESPLEVEEDYADEGTQAFRMTKTSGGGFGTQFYQCFQVSGGHGNYLYTADPTTGIGYPPPSWLAGVDIVPVSQLASPFGQPPIYPVPGENGIDLTSETEACLRIKTTAELPFEGATLDVFFNALNFTVSSITDEDPEAVAVMKVRLDPDGEDEEPEGPSVPTPVTGINPQNMLMTGYWESWNEATWQPGDPQLEIESSYTSGGRHWTCFRASGGSGSFVWHANDEFVSRPDWVLHFGFPGESDLVGSAPEVWRIDGTWPDWDSHIYATGAEVMCVGMDVGVGTYTPLTMKLYLHDYGTLHLPWTDTTPDPLRSVEYTVKFYPTFD